ncbi:hypothetical protein [Streptomyces sp. NPDC051286]|uniref:hypothetical protein n=1 Tax=Streptomyces sp. NPDC051286 TaxID=3365647 RepID=UPI0037AD07E6
MRKEACLRGLGTGLTRGLSTDYVGTGAASPEGLPGWTIAEATMDGSRIAAIAIRSG